MSLDGFDGAVLSVGREHAFPQPASLMHRCAVLEELRFVRREAQAEADLAYADWSQSPSPARWTVYRAAQDRADAGQDALAGYSRTLAATPG